MGEVMYYMSYLYYYEYWKPQVWAYFMLIQQFELLPFISNFVVIDWGKCNDYELLRADQRRPLFVVIYGCK